MSGEDELSPIDRELERRLGRLSPAVHGITRDRLMYLAGQRANARRVRRWQSATALVAIVAAVLGWSGLGTVTSRSPGIMAEVGPDSDQRSEAAASDAAVSAGLTGPLENRPRWSSEFIELRGRLVMEGVDALPTYSYAAPSPDAGNTVADWQRLLRGDAGIERERGNGGRNTVGERS